LSHATPLKYDPFFRNRLRLIAKSPFYVGHYTSWTAACKGYTSSPRPNSSWRSLPVSAWPRHKKLFSTGSIPVCYGKAITAEQAKKTGDKKLAEVLTDTLRQTQTKIRVKQGKKPYEY